jgi:hypothetical protein
VSGRSCWPLLLLGLLAMGAAGPAGAARPERVLVSRTRAVGGIAADTSTVVGELLTQALADDARYQVVAASEATEIARAVADQGCDDADCLLEIAGAMGVDHVVMSMLSARGEGFVLELGWLEVASMHLRRTVRVEVATIEALPARLRPALRELSLPSPAVPGARRDDDARPVVPRRDVEVAAAHPAATGPSWLALGGLASGAAALALVVATAVASLSLRESIASATTPRDTKDAILIAGPLVLVGGSCGSCLLLGAGGCLGALALVE